VNIIFDLDGTLTDSELGITRCLIFALERLGVAALERAQLRRYIGTPLRQVFGEMLATSDSALIERAVELYRERFGEVGLYENELYTGTAESLTHLRGSGHTLFLATAKAEVYARRVIEHFGLVSHFAGVYGAALSGEGSKKAELLARLVSEEGIEPAESVMIGDRGGDVAGARANRMRSIGVLWGYGTAEELVNADVRVATWAELVREVRGMDA